MNALDALEKSAFDSYDEDHYDADNYTPAQRRTGAAGTLVKTSRPQLPKGGQVPASYFTITITNDDTSGRTVELFNPQTSISEMTNGEFFPNYIPILSGATSVLNTTPTDIITYYGRKSTDLPSGGCFVYWDASGSLVYVSANGVTTVSCKEIPYRALMKYVAAGSFTINRMRMNFTTVAQTNNDMTLTKSNFLGKAEKNVLSINTFFSPDQFQTLRVDIPTTIPIDKERGIVYPINSYETVSIVMAIGHYTKSGIA